MCPPLPGKAIKQFFFFFLFFSISQQTVSKIQSGISAQRPSFWHHPDSQVCEPPLPWVSQQQDPWIKQRAKLTCPLEACSLVGKTEDLRQGGLLKLCGKEPNVTVLLPILVDRCHIMSMSSCYKSSWILTFPHLSAHRLTWMAFHILSSLDDRGADCLPNSSSLLYLPKSIQCFSGYWQTIFTNLE